MAKQVEAFAILLTPMQLLKVELLGLSCTGGNLVFKFNMFIIPRKVDFVCSNKMQLLHIQVKRGFIYKNPNLNNIAEFTEY